MQRNQLIERVRRQDQWDVVVVGGGATGLGTALDAASRGYDTLLLEAYDFAKGTSSRSTKLIHGGVRYLAQGNVSLVREALHERGRLLRNAPHLVHPVPFVVPGYRWWDTPYYGLGLILYSVLAGRLGIKFAYPITSKRVLQLAPTVKADGLVGGVVYYDGQFDDARLAIALLLTLFDQRGVALNYAPVTDLLKENGQTVGVQMHDLETKERFDIPARVVVNATGVFADELRRIDDPLAQPVLEPSQGIHLVLDRSFLPGDYAMMLPRTDDGRVLFAIPWHNRVIVGTTDTPVAQTDVEPRPQEQEISYLLDHTARYLSKAPRREDVLSVFTGLRPLVKAGDATTTAALSREHALFTSPSGLITITGGKWTTYRNMAADTVDRAIEVGSLPPRPCTTASLKLHGWEKYPVEVPFDVYGSDAPAVKRLLAEQPGWEEPLHPKLPYRTGEVVWAARHELARTVDDVLSRRTRALLLDAHASLEVAPKVAALLAAELGFDAAWQAAQMQEFAEIAQQYTVPPIEVLEVAHTVGV